MVNPAEIGKVKRDLAALLRERKIRCTPQRLQILEILEAGRGPQSAEDVFGHLPANSCDLATVYRNLQQLEDQEIIEKTYLSDQKARYCLRESHGHHHHHIECRKCGKIMGLDQCGIGPTLKKLQAMGFKDITHRLEFQALCPACAKKAER